MSLETTPTEDDIVARISTQVIPRVVDTEVPEATTVAVPYILIEWGGPVRSEQDHHITSTVNDTLIGYGTFTVVSSDARSAKQVADKLRKALTGYRPVDSGEMILEGGVTYSNATTTVKPNRFYRSLAYSWRTNLSWVDTTG
jgi:hypothetical protein